MKNVSLTWKITGGFGLIILIAVFLGFMGLANMSRVKKTAEILQKEYIEEAVIAGELERNAYHTMYSMRGYGLSEKENYLTQGLEALEAVDKNLQDAEALAKRAKHLNQLQASIDPMTDEIANYKQLVAETKQTLGDINQNRKALDESARAYMEHLKDFQENQQQLLYRDYEERHKKVDYAVQLMNLGNAARVKNFRAQAREDRDTMEEALQDLGAVEGLVKNALQITRDAGDIEALETILESAKGYSKAISEYLDNWEDSGASTNTSATARLLKQMDKFAAAYIDGANQYFHTQQEKLEADIFGRFEKVSKVTEVIAAGNEIRVNNWKAQAQRDTEITRKAINSFDAIDQLLNSLRDRVIATDGANSANLTEIEDTRKAGNAYKQSMSDLLDNWLALNELGLQRDKTGDSVLTKAEGLLTAASTQSKTLSGQAVEDLASAMSWMLVLLLIAIIFAAATAWLIARGILNPVKALMVVVKALAAKDLTKVSGIDQKDEIGVLALAMDNSSEELRSIMRELGDNAASLASASEQLSSISNEGASSAEEMTAQANMVAASGEQLSTNINSIASMAEQLSSNINAMAASAEEMSSSADNVASAIEEMSSSINEVAKNCAKESEIAGRANDQATATRDVMRKLGDSAREISSVVEIISGIASQTNLLALNATIEAASAGEAGKGFAVVANEVKELARQSGKATEKISRQIEEMQRNTEASVTAIDEITHIIEEVNQIAHSISASVEEQSATANEIARSMQGVSTATNELSRNVQESATATRELSRNAQEGANGATDVSSNIQGVNNAARQSAAGATETNASAGELSRMATRLKEIVNQFRV